MSASDTPRTDANVASLAKTPDCFCEADFARQLERELSAAREEIDKRDNDAACVPEDMSVSEYVAHLKAELSAAKRAGEGMAAAITPFIEFERCRRSGGSNTPRTGSIYGVHTSAGSAELTCEMFDFLREALSAYEATRKV